MVMLISEGYTIHCEIMGVGRSFVVYPIGSPDHVASTSYSVYELCGKVHSLLSELGRCLSLSGNFDTKQMMIQYNINIFF